MTDPFLGVSSDKELQIENLGVCSYPNKFIKKNGRHVPDDRRIAVYTRINDIEGFTQEGKPVPSFEVAGSRGKIFFDPKKTVCGIVTCGGLCPGLNDVIRSIALTLRRHYNVKKVIGFRYGYLGMTDKSPHEPVHLTEEKVANIHEIGGTILGSSRGPQKPCDMVDCLVKNKVNILFTIGGDGTLRGARDIVQEVKRRKLAIAVVGIPKTIDNDIQCITQSFGFSTAVEASRNALVAAHSEAIGAFNGIGLVKLMGRDSGFITAHATLANSHVNACFIPEVPFTLTGRPDSLLPVLEKRLKRKRHAVIVTAEGAGQDLVKEVEIKTDASGNRVYQDIGLFLKEAIRDYFKKKSFPVSVKYIDPSYMIRSLPANSLDSTFCLRLGQDAVHAGMAGKTNLIIGVWNQHFTHVPIDLAIRSRRKIDPNGSLWKSVLATFG